jgi:hypothetical protein
MADGRAEQNGWPFPDDLFPKKPGTPSLGAGDGPHSNSRVSKEGQGGTDDLLLPEGGVEEWRRGGGKMERVQEGAAVGRVVPDGNGGQQWRRERGEGKQQRVKRRGADILHRVRTMTKEIRRSKTARTWTREGGIAANIVNNGGVCRFLMGATKAMANGQGADDDELQDDATTDIFSDNLPCCK